MLRVQVILSVLHMRLVIHPSSPPMYRPNFTLNGPWLGSSVFGPTDFLSPIHVYTHQWTMAWVYNSGQTERSIGELWREFSPIIVSRAVQRKLDREAVPRTRCIPARRDNESLHMLECDTNFGVMHRSGCWGLIQ